jgi:hypothetical protein
MWSLTSPNAERISGPKKFGSSTKKDFFNSIGAERTLIGGIRMSADFEYFRSASYWRLSALCSATPAPYRCEQQQHRHP